MWTETCHSSPQKADSMHIFSVSCSFRVGENALQRISFAEQKNPSTLPDSTRNRTAGSYYDMYEALTFGSPGKLTFLKTTSTHWPPGAVLSQAVHSSKPPRFLHNQPWLLHYRKWKQAEAAAPPEKLPNIFDVQLVHHTSQKWSVPEKLTFSRQEKRAILVGI